MTAREILDIYISFFEKRGHKRIPNSPLVPENDPTTLFTSSGMQPLIQYLLGQEHPQGVRLVDVQNSFRAQDIEEIGDNRHTTFFRMLGNWSLGDYFKKEEIPWLWEFLTSELKLDSKRLYVSVFEGNAQINIDEISASLWKDIFDKEGFNQGEKIFYCGVEENWWSRSGVPNNMPVGEPGGPDTEVYFDFHPEQEKITQENFVKHANSGRLLEIANAVFMEYQKEADGFKKLPQQNVDFGGGLERLLAAVENKSDIFETNLYQPIVNEVIKSYFHGIYEDGKDYKANEYPGNPKIYSNPEEQQLAKENRIKSVRIVLDHFISAVFITAAGVVPSKTEQGYILRRLIRRGLDSLYFLGGRNIENILHKIVEQYEDTDLYLTEKYEEIKYIILEEQEKYEPARTAAIDFLSKKYPSPSPSPSPENDGPIEISASDAFNSLATLGTAPTQLKSLGYTFNNQELAELIKSHAELSRAGAQQKFKGGLADTSEQTVMGHTATHLLHQALRDVLGNSVHQTGSNITSERIRFDFNFDRNLTEEELKKVESIVNEKIKENLPVHFEIMPLIKAKELGAIGLFDDKYQSDVKVYFVGDYSKEFCGGPHVEFTGELNRFKIIKQENLGKGQKRIYSKVNSQIQ